jgi:hypothetical protein
MHPQPEVSTSPVTLLLASGANLSSTAELPWWTQLSIGIVMLLTAGCLHELDKRIDSDFLGLAAFLIGLAGFAILLSALL